jgi:hypothetical protein
MKKIIKNFKRDGYVVVKNFFKKKDILDAKKEIFNCSQKLYKKKLKKKILIPNTLIIIYLTHLNQVKNFLLIFIIYQKNLLVCITLLLIKS